MSKSAVLRVCSLNHSRPLSSLGCRLNSSQVIVVWLLSNGEIWPAPLPPLISLHNVPWSNHLVPLLHSFLSHFLTPHSQLPWVSHCGDLTSLLNLPILSLPASIPLPPPHHHNCSETLANGSKLNNANDCSGNSWFLRADRKSYGWGKTLERKSLNSKSSTFLGLHLKHHLLLSLEFTKNCS